jgi:hypothetical protein
MYKRAYTMANDNDEMMMADDNDEMMMADDNDEMMMADNDVQKVSMPEPDEEEYVEDDEEVEVQKVSTPAPVKPVSPCKCGQR